MSYHEEEKRDLTIHLRKLLRELPEFCYEYFRGIEPTTAERTRLGYAHDLRIFFQFLRKQRAYSQDTLAVFGVTQSWYDSSGSWAHTICVPRDKDVKDPTEISQVVMLCLPGS